MNIKSFKKPLLATAVSLGMGLGVAGNAQAAVYALSWNDISNLNIGVVPGAPDNPALPLTSIFRLDATGDLGSVAGVDSHNAVFPPAGVGSLDVDQGIQQVGGVPILNNTPGAQDNSLTTHEGAVWGTYARSDAQIPTHELNPGAPPTPTGDPTRSLNIAESQLLGNDTGRGDAGNSSVTDFSFTAAAGTTVSFAFDADPYLKAFVDAPPAIFPSNASAEITVQFLIRNSSNTVVFDWRPGEAAIGGVSVDPFLLNQLVTATSFNPGPNIYDPTGDGIGGATGAFSASTTLLTEDTYTLELRMRETVNTQRVVGIPEIDAVAGTGALTLLAGSLVLAGERRRRKTV